MACSFILDLVQLVVLIHLRSPKFSRAISDFQSTALYRKTFSAVCCSCRERSVPSENAFRLAMRCAAPPFHLWKPSTRRSSYSRLKSRMIPGRLSSSSIFPPNCQAPFSRKYCTNAPGNAESPNRLLTSRFHSRYCNRNTKAKTCSGVPFSIHSQTSKDLRLTGRQDAPQCLEPTVHT